MKNLALLLFSMLLLTGCGTVVTYKQNTAAGLAKGDNYPIPVYTEDQTVPRPCEIIGTVSVGDTFFTVTGGSAEAVTLKVMRTAHEKGADAVQITSIRQPGFTSANYHMTANLLRYTDTWETVAISENEFLAYLQKNARTLDPIEGVWSEYGREQQRIGIMKNHSKAGRDYVGFILDSENPAWRLGTKKIDICRGLEPDSYVLTYYLDDFEPREIPILLGRKRTFTLAIQKADSDGDFIMYIKN